MFKTVFALSALIISSCGVATPAAQSFMPDNDLWKEDCLECKNGAMTQALFNEICDAGKKAFSEETRANNERMVINKKWTDSTVNANVCRGCVPGEVTINMFGGLSRRQEVNLSGFAIVLSHELGHAYGGAPYINASRKMSAEGQADWYSTLEAYRRIYALVPALQNESGDYGSFIEEVCKVPGMMEDSEPVMDKRCMNSLLGGKGLATLLANLMQEPIPQFETPDPTVVTSTQLSYPETVQCRLDTYVAGTLDKSRPLCWFKN